MLPWKRMVPAKYVVLVALGLLFTQFACAATCLGQLCDLAAKTESLPPCHRHHDQSRDQKPASCEHQTMVAMAQTQQMDISLFPEAVLPAAMSAACPAEMRTRELGFLALSPPESQSLSSVVLRI